MSKLPNQPDAGVLRAFVDTLGAGNLCHELRQGLIGEGAQITGPAGSRPLIYAGAY
jgi:hypothetical protein